MHAKSESEREIGTEYLLVDCDPLCRMADALATCEAELAARRAELEQAESALAELEGRFADLSSKHEVLVLDKARLQASNNHLGAYGDACVRLNAAVVCPH